MTLNYEEEIRQLSDEYQGLTGQSPFIGAENWTDNITTYMFANDRNFSDGEEALGYMRGLLDDAYKDLKPLHQWRPVDEP